MKNKILATAMLLVLLVGITPIIPTLASGSALGGTWFLDEGSGNVAYDSSGNGNHGTIYSAVWVSGKVGKALEFDGVNDYVEVPDSNSLDITGKITLEAWIYPHTVTSTQVIVQKYNYTGPPYNGAYYLGVGGYGYNNKILFGLSHNGYNFYYILSNTNITANTWTHVAATSNGTHMMIYINGIKDKVATYPPGVIYASTAPLRIGCFLPELGVSRFFDGVIDEVRVSAGTIWTVDDDRVQCPNADFASIQAAINVASNDDTILVHDGTYNEALYINKSLTIKGASTPIIQGSGSFATNYGAREAVIFVENAYVVLESLDIEGQGLGPGKNYGIIYEESNGTIRNCIVSPNTINDMSGNAIGAWDSSNLTAELSMIKNFGRIGVFYYDGCSGGVYDSIIEGQIYGDQEYVNYGIEIETYEYSCNIKIIGNEIYNCDNTHPSPSWSSAGIVIDGWLGYYYIPSSTVVISNNNIHDNYYGIEVVANPYSYAHYNNIYDNREYGVIQDPDYNGNNVTFDARFNWWGNASGPTHSSNLVGSGDVISDNVDYSPWLGATFETTPRTYHVNPSGAPGAIQEAIDEASPGDTVVVHDGTYDEQVVINKSLTVQGTGSTPVIKPSSAAQLTTILGGCYWGGTVQIAGIIVANVADGSSVTVKNLIVDGQNVITKPTGADYVTGIFYRETGGLIDTVAIANMTIDATGTSVRAYGIYLSAIVNTVSVEVKDCNITNYDKNGLNAHGDKLTVNIRDNTIAGRGPLPSGDEVQNGIVIMDGAIATVNSNTISNMAYMPETWWSAGILFLDGGNGCSANYNIINDCQIGIVFNDMSGSATGNTVNGGTEGKAGLVLQQSWGTGTWTASFVGNTVSGCDTEGIGVHSYDVDTSLTATIDSNQLNGGLGVGIVIGDIPNYSPAGNITVIITNNNISNWHHGIYLASSVIGATITNNTITDFIKDGIVTRGAKNIHIEGNTISTTLHDEAPNGIDIGTYSGTSGTVKGNEISGCSWNGFTGDYETSWSGSGILVIESGDSLEIIGNTVHDCDVGMDIESDSMNITSNEVHDNIYGFVFWNSNPKVNYNNIYNNPQYGVYRTLDLTGVLNATCNWWGDSTGPYHATSWMYMGSPYGPHYGLGDNVSDYVLYDSWLQHDISVISVTISTSQAYFGTIVNINVTVENQGDYTETFNVTVYANTTIIATLLTNITLTSGNSTTITFTLNTTGVPYGIYTITATATQVPGETNTTDNTLIDGIVTITALGDINGDGHVRYEDLSLLASHWYGHLGYGLGYNPNADLNNDGKIRYEDLSILCTWWYKGPLD